MKIIILLGFIVSISFSQTGNDFLKKYPIDKRMKEMSNAEFFNHKHYLSLIYSVKEDTSFSSKILDKIASGEKYLSKTLKYRTCGMSKKQEVRVIKKWCDENPESMNKSFSFIVISSFMELPLKTEEECLELNKKKQ